MNMFEKLYDQSESVKVQFVGFTTEEVRYDFGIVFTNMFFGKPLVICMQTGRSSLISSDELTNIDHLKTVFRIHSYKEAEDLALFLKEILPYNPLETQYD
jgi:hypothetical protein